MKQKIVELSVQEVIRINAILCARYGEPHILRDKNALHSAIEVGAFYRLQDGRYLHGGVAAIAGVMCYKIAQVQAFVNGNKRTADLAAKAFLGLNGFRLQYPKGSMEDLILGFAEPQGAPQYTVEDSKEWFMNHAYQDFSQ